MGILATGTIGSLNAINDVTSLDSLGSIGIIVTGTWVGILTFQGSLDGINFVDIIASNLNSNILLTITSSNGSFLVNSFGLKTLRIKMTSYTSGTATVSFQNAPGIAFQNSVATLQGNTDGTKIGNIADRLKVETAIGSVTGAISASYSSKTRVDLITTPVTLVTGSYINVYSYSGTGLLIGISAEFNNTAILCRLRIDGEDLTTGQSLATLGGFQATTNTSDRRQNGQGIIINGSNLDISFRQPIRFTSSVVLSADANGGVLLARQLSQALIYIVKET